MRPRRLFPFLCAFFLIFAWHNAPQLRAFWQALARAGLSAGVGGRAATRRFAQSARAFCFALRFGRTSGALAQPRARSVGRALRQCRGARRGAGRGETALLFDQARRRGWDLALVALVATLYFALNFAVFAGRLLKKSMPFSPLLHRKITPWVYLPPGYGKTNARYPVVYLLHGSRAKCAIVSSKATCNAAPTT